MSDHYFYFDAAADLHREFPILWDFGEALDFAERTGREPSPLQREADAVLRELWQARTQARATQELPPCDHCEAPELHEGPGEETA